MNFKESDLIGNVIGDDYRIAAVFAKYGIDFCCKSNLSLLEAGKEMSFDTSQFISDLQIAIEPLTNASYDLKNCPADLLTDYIEKRHHRYVNVQAPVIQQYLARLCQVHEKNHPELSLVLKYFNSSLQALAVHMKKEELVLFPYVRKMIMARENEVFIPHFGTVKSPVEVMLNEHDHELERFNMISELTASYTPPLHACNLYRVTYACLKAFHEDLKIHIEIENNILFPKALTLELEMRSAMVSR